MNIQHINIYAIRGHISECIQMYIYLHICTYLHVYICIFKYIYMHKCVHAQEYTTHKCICHRGAYIGVYTDVYMYIFTYIHMHIYIYIYAQMCTHK